jgi:hypothetical protein
MTETLRKLKQELQEQVVVQSRLLNVENDFFDSAKKLEHHRHDNAMKSLEEAQIKRIRQVKGHEEHYMRHLSQARSQFAARKKAATRTFQRDLARLQPGESATPDDGIASEDEIVDEKYAEIAAAEIRRLRSESRGDGAAGKMQNRRLLALAEEIEGYIQVT